MQKKSAVWYALIVLFLINTINFFDRQILGAIGEPIRKEFELSDSALGLLNTAFTLLYAFVGLPFGRLADSAKRKWILAGGVFAWSLLTAASGLAQNFWQIFALRLGVGIGEASFAPAANSLIADFFPSEKRGKAAAIFMLGLPVGLALSFAVSGAVAQRYDWRAAFFVAGLPGLLCVVLAFFIKEPERGASENSLIGTKKRAGSPFKIILAMPTMRWLIVSGAVHNFSLYALSAFITPYLMRFHKLNIQDANFISTILYAFLTLPLLAGGIVGDWAKKRRADGALLIATFAILLSIPFFFFALQTPSGNVTTFLVLIGGSVALMYFYYSIVYATIADVTEPALRGTAMAIYFMAMYLLGASFGPYAVGLLSDFFTQKAAITSGVADFSPAALEPFRAAGLRSAMYIVPVFSFLLTAILWLASRSVQNDVGKLQAWINEQNKANL